MADDAKLNVIITRKEAYERLYHEVNDIKEQIQSAGQQETVNQALEAMEALLEAKRNDSRFEEVSNLVVEIIATISAVKLHDSTRKILIELLDIFLKQISSILEAERKKENVCMLRRLFQAMSEHAEEIANIIDINNIFG